MGDKNGEDIHGHINLWEHFAFLPERCADEARAILYSEPCEESMKRAALVIAQYEQVLLECPVNFELYHHYVYLHGFYAYSLQYYSHPWGDNDDQKPEVVALCDKISYLSHHMKQIVEMLM